MCDTQHVGSPAYSTCGQQGVAVKPAAGDALLFFSQTAANGLDDLSLHSGCPVIRGNKWCAGQRHCLLFVSALQWLRRASRSRTTARRELVMRMQVCHEVDASRGVRASVLKRLR